MATTEVEVLPPAVHQKVNALQTLDGEAQARAVTAMLSHSRTGLLAAVAAQDLPQIVEFKAKASAIQEISKQLRLGKDMQADAAEFLRRAERGLGVAIREGQARGEITDRGNRNNYGSATFRQSRGSTLSSPSDFLPTGSDREKTYTMTDNVSDDQFDDALSEAREENNLSRANVARKCKAKASEEVAPGITADDLDALNVPKRTIDPRSEQILDHLVSGLDGMCINLRYLKKDQLDPDTLERRLNQASESLASIRKTIKEIRHAQ